MAGSSFQQFPKTAAPHQEDAASVSEIEADRIWLSDGHRRREVAGILAAGVLRLRSRAALPAVKHLDPGLENLPDSVPNCLEVSAETVLSVHTG